MMNLFNLAHAHAHAHSKDGSGDKSGPGGILPKIRLNPDFKDQSLHVYSAAIAGPALMYAGYKFPGSTTSKVVLTGAGAFLIYTHYSMLKSMLSRKAQSKNLQVKQIASGLISAPKSASSSQKPVSIEEFPDLTPEEIKEIDESAVNTPEFSIFDKGTVRGSGAQEDLGFDIKDFAGFFR